MKLTFDNWRQRLRDAANRAGLPRFWRWWVGELAPLLPAASRVAIRRRFARPVVELAEGEAVFWRPDFGDGRTRLAVVERVSLVADSAAVLAACRAAVARLAANASGGIAAPKVVVALSPRKVLRKQLLLPAAVEENLAQTLAYDLDRHTPFRPEQVYFDAVVVARDSVKKMLRIDWVAALRTVVDDARKQVEDWGAVPIAVVPGPPGVPTRLNLIPHVARPRPLQWRRWQVWAPLAAVAAFAFAAVFVPLAQKRQYAIALNVLNAEAAQQAQAADAVRRQLEAMQSDYNYILTKKYTYPSAVHVLDEVTRTLPDDTWLTQFELKTAVRARAQRDLYLRGESDNAGKLIACSRIQARSARRRRARRRPRSRAERVKFSM
jgi:general secretion pathway protein L